jgi:hypothetical protein
MGPDAVGPQAGENKGSVTMKRSVIGVLCGALAFYVWNMLSWLALPLHDNSIKTLPEETLITDTLKTVIPEAGTYMFPSRKSDGQTLEQKAWAEKYFKGPTGILIFAPGGKESVSPARMAIGFLNDVALAILGMLLLSLTRDRVRTFFQRVALMTALGAMVVLAVHVPYWNWLGFTSDFTGAAIVDSLVGFCLLGLVQAPFVRRG